MENEGFESRLVSAGVALAALTAADAMAQDGHVTWHDDGSVDLIMEDGAVIKTSRDELGSLFGPGEKPFEGTTLTVLTLDSGPRGGISGPIFSFRRFGRSCPAARSRSRSRRSPTSTPR